MPDMTLAEIEKASKFVIVITLIGVVTHPVIFVIGLLMWSGLYEKIKRFKQADKE